MSGAGWRALDEDAPSWRSILPEGEAPVLAPPPAGWASIREDGAVASGRPLQVRAAAAAATFVLALLFGGLLFAGRGRNRPPAPTPPAVAAAAPAMPEAPPPVPEKPPEPPPPAPPPRVEPPPAPAKTFEAETAELERELAAPAARGEFRLVLEVLQRARARVPDEAWMKLVDSRIKTLHEEIAARYGELKGMALAAKAKGDAAEVARLRERVAKLGLDGHVEDLERALETEPAVAKKARTLEPPAEPERSAEGRAHRAEWERAMAFALGRDCDRAAAELVKASRAWREEDVRREAQADIEDLRRLSALHEAVLRGLARRPPGSVIALDRRDLSGEVRRVAGTLVAADVDRAEIRTGPGRPAVFVEFSDVTAASLAESLGKPEDRRTPALLCLAEGEWEAALDLLEGKLEAVPAKWWAFGKHARTRLPKPERHELSARDLLYAAERDWRLPTTRGLAVEKYRMLGREYTDLSIVRRAIDRITKRSEPCREYFFARADLRGGGTFKTATRPLVGDCWLSTSGSDLARAHENYVELEFYAFAGVPYRLWAQAGGCCAETFACYWQASELSGPHPTKPNATLRIEPASIYGMTARLPSVALKPAHSAHAGRNEAPQPAVWAWVEFTLPKFATPGIKRVRILTDRQGFGVARALVSALKSAAPGEAELRELEAAREAEGAPPVAMPAPAGGGMPDLVGHWTFEEGAGPVAGDASGNGHVAGLEGKPEWIEGKSGGALRFGTKEDAAVVQDAPRLRLTGDLSIAFWVKLERAVATRRLVVGKGEGDYAVWLFPGDRLLFEECDAAGQRVVALSVEDVLPPGAWHHVAAVVKSGKAFLYVNGRQAATGSCSGPPTASPGPLRFGAGALDDLRLYSRALSPDEVKSLAASR